MGENDLMIEQMLKSGTNSGALSPSINLPAPVFKRVKKSANNWAQSPMVEQEIEILEGNQEIVRLSIPEPIAKYCHE